MALLSISVLASRCRRLAFLGGFLIHQTRSSFPYKKVNCLKSNLYLKVKVDPSNGDFSAKSVSDYKVCFRRKTVETQ